MRSDDTTTWRGVVGPWWHDARQGVRTLASKPEFTVLAVLTLVLCIGANALVFTIVNALWLRDPALPEPDRVVMVALWDVSDVSGSEEGGWSAEGGLEALRRKQMFEVVAGQVATTGENAEYLPRLSLDRVAREVEAIGVTSGYFSVMGLRILGRDFTEDDDRLGAAPVVIVSDRLWRTAFGASREVVGSVVAASPVPVRIVGVAPPGFHGARLGERADLWMPRYVVPQFSPSGPWVTERRGQPPLLVLARLRPGVSPADAQRALLLARDPRTPAFLQESVIPIRQVFGTPFGRTVVVQPQAVFWIAAAMAALVLVAGCATLLALVLVYYERRRAELAIRMALGCSRARLVRTLVVELGGLSVLGAAGALAIAAAGLGVLPAFSLSGVDLGRLDLNPDWRVVAFAMLVSIVTLLVAALVPLRRSTRPALVMDLVSTSARTTASSLRLRRDIMTLHIAATVVVLISAGLFVRTVVNGFTRKPGFDIDRTLFVDATVGSRLASEIDRGAFGARDADRAQRLLDALGALPGVVAASLGRAPHGSGTSRPWTFTSGSRVQTITYSAIGVGPAYLDVLNVPLIAGRGFTEPDRQDSGQGRVAEPVVVTKSFADALWPGGSGVGQRFTAAGSPRIHQVVGVADDLAFGSLRLDQRAGFFFLTDVETSVRRRTVQLALRANDPARLVPAVRRTISEIFPDASRVDMATGREIDAHDLNRERLGAWFFSGFGLVALALGVGGAFGLVAYVAESRRREMGIRLALGAMPGQLLRVMVSAGLWPVLVGTAAGLGLGAVVGHVIGGYLIGVSGVDPTTFAVVGGLMLASTAAASAVAAWRVRRVSPTEVLRAE